MTHNDVVYEVAKRARLLGALKLDDLRSYAGYDCDTRAESIRMNKNLKRGELIEWILVEEFIREIDMEFLE